MRLKSVIIGLLLFSKGLFSVEEITPYKFFDAQKNNGLPEYFIPQASIFSVERKQKDAQNIIYYFSKPNKNKKFPIVIFCTGSSAKDIMFIDEFGLETQTYRPYAWRAKARKSFGGRKGNVVYACSLIAGKRGKELLGAVLHETSTTADFGLTTSLHIIFHKHYRNSTQCWAPCFISAAPFSKFKFY